jgi:hypothetical protein
MLYVVNWVFSLMASYLLLSQKESNTSVFGIPLNGGMYSDGIRLTVGVVLAGSIC